MTTSTLWVLPSTTIRLTALARSLKHEAHPGLEPVVALLARRVNTVAYGLDVGALLETTRKERSVRRR